MPRASDVGTPSVWSVYIDQFDCHSGIVYSTSPLTVESTSQQWAYVVSLPLPLAELPLAAPMLVTANVAVADGLVGALVVGEELTQVLALARLPVAIGNQRLELIVQQRSPARLVFRNCTPGDRSCRFTIESVSVQQAGPDALTPASRLSEVTEGQPIRISMSKLRGALRAWRDNS